jgi:hypothetical protein
MNFLVAACLISVDPQGGIMKGVQLAGESMPKLETYEDLEKFLRSWGSFKDAEVYDLVGMAHLLGACLDNLRDNVSDVGLEELGGCLSESQIAFLKKLAEIIAPGYDL